jgi:hypothetical protein
MILTEFINLSTPIRPIATYAVEKEDDLPLSLRRQC